MKSFPFCPLPFQFHCHHLSYSDTAPEILIRGSPAPWHLPPSSSSCPPPKEHALQPHNILLYLPFTSRIKSTCLGLAAKPLWNPDPAPFMALSVPVFPKVLSASAKSMIRLHPARQTCSLTLCFLNYSLQLESDPKLHWWTESPE